MLGEDCLINRELDNCVMGEVKDFASINNMYVLLSNEGFQQVTIVYLGGLWDSFARKRICIKTSQENNILERFKVIVRGKIFVLRAKELFAWSPSFKDVKDIKYCSDNDVNNDDIANSAAEDNYEAEVVESDDDYVSNTKFDDQEVKMKHGFTEKCSSAEKEVLSDPFNLNELLNRRGSKPKDTTNSGVESSLPFLPGFTPDKDKCQDDVPNNDHGDAGVKSPIPSHSKDLSPRVMEDAQPTNAHESNKGEKDPISGGSILEVLENMIKVGNAMGLGSKTKKDWIKELNNKNKVNFLPIQETKMDCISDMKVKALWGNHKFEFIISEAVDRNLSDHRPILLREVVTDYGPSPFRIYHSWLNFEGFDKMILDTWNGLSFVDSNHMLHPIDIELEKGGSNEDILLARMDLLKRLNDFQSSEARDRIQKAKIQWAIEGDENSKFFHGVINRKRANLALKGVMVDGVWMDDPCLVKEEFRLHFAS
nr:RNA-directed DNA polymerase, eukaryota [Tanacetum cinerariifolium]